MNNRRGDYALALTQLLEALSLSEAGLYLETQANVIKTMGVIQMRLANYPEALAHQLKAIEIFKEIDNTLDDVYILFARHENKIYEKYAITQFDKGATGVVFGHTHHPYVKKIGNKFYGNCGCWWGKKDYIDVILIDTKSDELLQYITLGEIDGQIIENIIPNLV